MDQNFVLHILESHMYVCQKSHILQKLHDSMRKRDFTNIWSSNLFEWIQNLTQNYLGIIVSAHTFFFSNHFSIP